MPYEEELLKNPYILIICRNPHSHANPSRVKTPPAHLSILRTLLLRMTWKLADTTPRRILLDNEFMAGLRGQLGWSDAKNPILADLHPSLANIDHVQRLISELRDLSFPAGTGFAGV